MAEREAERDWKGCPMVAGPEKEESPEMEVWRGVECREGREPSEDWLRKSALERPERAGGREDDVRVCGFLVEGGVVEGARVEGGRVMGPFLT